MMLNVNKNGLNKPFALVLPGGKKASLLVQSPAEFDHLAGVHG